MGASGGKVTNPHSWEVYRRRNYGSLEGAFAGLPEPSVLLYAYEVAVLNEATGASSPILSD